MADGPIYLDYNATTPLDPRVFEAMTPWLLTPANAGSRTHVYGQRAKEAVEEARLRVAEGLNVGAEEIVFTSGATESNNLAILGIAPLGESSGRRHILSTTIEHKAVLEPLDRLQRMGFDVELVPVTTGGYVDPTEISHRVRNDTLLISVMHANNETGVLQPIQEISRIARDRDIYFHTDAAQTYGKEVDVLPDVFFDFLSISSHKVYGPQGVGALAVRRRSGKRCPLSSIILGGGQERGLRPGTVPVPLVVGLGAAAKYASLEYEERRSSSGEIKSRFLDSLEKVEHHVNGDLTRSQSHVLNVCFPGVDSEALMLVLREELAFSNGSACTSASYDPSHVLIAMGLSEDAASESVRLSWGSGVEDFDVSVLVDAVEQTRVVL